MANAVIFQYQYGAIKGIKNGLGDYQEITFQYQYGAIKGNTAIGAASYTLLFQYQYGAIKGTLLLVSPFDLVYFNTNMVRLKAPSATIAAYASGISIPIWCD